MIDVGGTFGTALDELPAGIRQGEWPSRIQGEEVVRIQLQGADADRPAFAGEIQSKAVVPHVPPPFGERSITSLVQQGEVDLERSGVLLPRRNGGQLMAEAVGLDDGQARLQRRIRHLRGPVEEQLLTEVIFVSNQEPVFLRFCETTGQEDRAQSQAKQCCNS